MNLSRGRGLPVPGDVASNELGKIASPDSVDGSLADLDPTGVQLPLSDPSVDALAADTEERCSLGGCEELVVGHPAGSGS